MLKIKLARFGKKNQPHYRVVVTEGKSKRDGQYKAQVGRYVPTANPKVLEIDMAEFEAWVKKGAQPTETVQGLFDRLKSGNPFPAKKARPSKKAMAKAKAEKAKAPAAEPAAKVAVETTTEAAAPAVETKEPKAEVKAEAVPKAKNTEAPAKTEDKAVVEPTTEAKTEDKPATKVTKKAAKKSKA
ncbi:MAG: 30S ribosomal protein S16 [Candidatus Pacebacteria bacterium CG_4_10_14_0_8_um_filter_43_12]|nr:MAG: 30S ribosomal protein S16 [Candidatus Pacebacteria bacterium CG10_big_fil_rev_8_21_14_0_10_44_11]PIY78968.1 MAG: 30S ribosomal protein S16 [Candidatus Pacebacteria bacterium CG_4_10_14_0_8_um_filter_43_12]